MPEYGHELDTQHWPTGTPYCLKCRREWPCEPSKLEQRIAALEATLARAYRCLDCDIEEPSQCCQRAVEALLATRAGADAGDGGQDAK